MSDMLLHREIMKYNMYPYLKLSKFLMIYIRLLPPLFFARAPRDMAQLAHASMKGERALDTGNAVHYLY